MRTNTQKLVAFLASLVLTIAAIEISLRIVAHSRLQRKMSDIDELLESSASFNRHELRAMWNPELSIYTERHDEARQHFAGLSRLRLAYRPWIERRRLPNQRSEGVHINSLGYRGADFSYQKPAGVRRVLLFGGSFVWGTGALRDSETIAGHLERMLKSAQSDRNWEVINAGETGYVTSQELNLLVHEGLFLDPDWVIFVDGYNDAHNVAYDLPAGYPGHFWQYNELLSKSYKRPLEETLEGQWAALAEETRLLTSFHRKPEISRLVQERLVLSAQSEHRANCGELALRHFHNMLVVEALARSFGFSTLFAFQPVAAIGKPLSSEEVRLVDLYRNEYPKKYELILETYECYGSVLGAAAAKEGIPFLDLTRIFSDVQSTVYVDFVHLDGAGYAKVASYLAQELLQSGDQPWN